jgi:GMP synthase (glutamine-hydrolysing)
VLTAAGYEIHYYDLGVHDLAALDPMRGQLGFTAGVI